MWRFLGSLGYLLSQQMCWVLVYSMSFNLTFFGPNLPYCLHLVIEIKLYRFKTAVFCLIELNHWLNWISVACSTIMTTGVSTFDSNCLGLLPLLMIELGRCYCMTAVFFNSMCLRPSCYCTCKRILQCLWPSRCICFPLVAIVNPFIKNSSLSLHYYEIVALNFMSKIVRVVANHLSCVTLSLNWVAYILTVLNTHDLAWWLISLSFCSNCSSHLADQLSSHTYKF